MATSLQALPTFRTEPNGSAVIRVLSYNIRSMRDDTEALARVIRACAPDLSCIAGGSCTMMGTELGCLF